MFSTPFARVYPTQTSCTHFLRSSVFLHRRREVDATGISTMHALVKRGTTALKHVPIVAARQCGAGHHTFPPHPPLSKHFAPHFRGASAFLGPTCLVAGPPFRGIPSLWSTLQRAPTRLKRTHSRHQWVGSALQRCRPPAQPAQPVKARPRHAQPSLHTPTTAPPPLRHLPALVDPPLPSGPR